MWIRRKINNKSEKINEHLVDNYPQMIFIMGLPAAGKSSFIKYDLQKYFPIIKQNRTLDLDIQLKKKQTEYAIDFAKFLYTLRNDINENVFNNIIKRKEKDINDDDSMQDREEFHISTTYEWFLKNKDLDEKKFIYNFLKDFFKKDWASNFIPRTAAKEEYKDIIADKIGVKKDDIIINNNDVVIPLLGDRITKILDYIDSARNDYVYSIIYLDIPLEEAIKRDKNRKNKEGRSVGEKIIREKYPYIENTWKDLKNGSYKRHGIYKLMHFVWLPNETPYGEYKLRQKFTNIKIIKKLFD